MSSVRCTRTHRIIHRAGFFPTATCQRQRLRQLTLGLARLGGLLTASQTGALGFFIPCCALSPAREEWEAASEEEEEEEFIRIQWIL